MTDFKKSLAIGLQAAQDAELKRKEIKEVIAELNRQIFDATDKKIRITIEDWDPLGLNSLIKIMQKDKSLNTQAVVATSVDGKTKESIASWEQAKDGYPCKVSIGSDFYSCEDKSGLENCFKSLLQDPTVGAKLHKLMTLNNS